MMMFTTY